MSFNFTGFLFFIMEKIWKYIVKKKTNELEVNSKCFHAFLFKYGEVDKLCYNDKAIMTCHQINQKGFSMVK